MTFSWYCSPEALPALVVRQLAAVSTGFRGNLPLGLWKYLAVSRGAPSLSTVVSMILNRPFSSMAYSLNSPTVMPLEANP